MGTTVIRKRLRRDNGRAAASTRRTAAVPATVPANATPTADGRRARSAAIAVPTFGVSAAGAYALAGSAQVAAAQAAWWRPDEAIGVALMGLGALIASWYALTALALLIGALGSLDLNVRKWGAPLLRTLSVGAGSLALAVGTQTVAIASSHAPPPDLAWGDVAELEAEPTLAPASGSPFSPTAPAAPDDLAWKAGAQDEDRLPDSLDLPVAPTAPTSLDDLAWGTEPAPLELREQPEGPVGSTGTDAPGDLSRGTAPAPINPIGQSVPTVSPSDLPIPSFPVAASGLPAPASATESPGVGSLPEQAPASATETHTVVAGESLWRIAEAENPEAHNAQIAERVAELIAANPEVHANPDLIFPGQILNIPGATS